MCVVGLGGVTGEGGNQGRGGVKVVRVRSLFCGFLRGNRGKTTAETALALISGRSHSEAVSLGAGEEVSVHGQRNRQRWPPARDGEKDRPVQRRSFSQ